MNGLSRSELATAAGVTADEIDRLKQLGILAPGQGERPFVRGDVYRIRVAKSCEQAGLPLEAIGRAVGEGKFSFAFLDLPSFAWSPLSSKTWQDVAEERGLPLGLLQRLREAQGFARPEPQEPVREDDLELLPIIELAMSSGLADEAALIRMARVYTEALRRIAQAETHLFHSNIEMRMLGSGMNQRQLIEFASGLGSQFVPLLDRTVLTVYQRQREREWIEDLIGHIESALEEAGYHQRLERPPAMCFLDLTGYTRLTEERGDRAAAELASSLATFVQEVSQAHGGQPVKWLGDGVMFHFKDPARAVGSALEMVDRTPEAGLPPAHAGVAAGPVIFQDGDYFGRTVNTAARISAHAGPGQVLVSEEVVELAEPDGITFREIGPVELKGLLRPVKLYAASQPSD